MLARPLQRELVNRAGGATAAVAGWMMEILKPRWILDVHRRPWCKIEHRVEGQVVEGVAEGVQTRLSFILVRPSIVILTQPILRPAPLPISLLRPHSIHL